MANIFREDVRLYHVFCCPHCGARHRFGHRKNSQICFRCYHEFSPELDSLRYERDRIYNSVDDLPSTMKDRWELDEDERKGIPFVKLNWVTHLKRFLGFK